MCFSATASFTAAAVAGSIGIVTLWKAAKLRDPALLPIAAFPVLFADQQFVEGLLWLDLARPEPGPCRPMLTHAFVAYAEIFWPIFAPLAAWLIEPVQWRRRLIGVCVLVGAAVSTYLLWKMLGSPYTASAATGHIVYSNDVAYPKGAVVVASHDPAARDRHPRRRRCRLLVLSPVLHFGLVFLRSNREHHRLSVRAPGGAVRPA